MENLSDLYNWVLTAKYIQLEENAASYCTEVSGDTLYILFEWSNGKVDWKNNFDFPARPYGEMKHRWFVHRGFLRVWKTIRDKIKAQVIDPNIKHIIVAGYSHGAAIAVLCHEYCVFNRPDIEISGYGFGAPRVVWGWLNKTVKRRFDNFYVIRNCRDIVTHVPPTLFGYRHVGNMIKIGVRGKYGLIDSHRPENYETELKKYEDKKASSPSA